MFMAQIWAIGFQRIDRTKYTNDLTNVDLINNRLNFNY